MYSMVKASALPLKSSCRTQARAHTHKHTHTATVRAQVCVHAPRRGAQGCRARG